MAKTVVQFCATVLLVFAVVAAVSVTVLNKPATPEFWRAIAFFVGLSVVGLLTARLAP